MAKKLKSLSIFFPAFNDEMSIGKLVEKSFKILPTISNKYEVIVINDGSTDNTAHALKILEIKYDHLKIITHNKNRGYGGALISGFKNSSMDFVFYTDGDGQYNVSELPKLINLMEDEVDLVNGYKIGRNDSLLRIILGKSYALCVRLLLGINFSDVDCDFRLFRRSILNKIQLTRSSGAICPEILARVQKAHGKILSAPVHHYPRLYGESQFFKPKRILKTIIDDLWLFWKLR